jgi:ribose-phosphate pyrophosphokinase
VIRDNVIIVSGSGNKKLSEEVSAFLGVKLVDIKTGNFKDGETFLKYDDDITNKDVVLICSLGKPANDTTMEALMLVSSLKRQGAKTVTLIQPYSSYAR